MSSVYLVGSYDHQGSLLSRHDRGSSLCQSGPGQLLNGPAVKGDDTLNIVFWGLIVLFLFGYWLSLSSRFWSIGDRFTSALKDAKDARKAEPGELVNGSILKQTQFRVSSAAARDDLYIHPVLQDKSSAGEGCKPFSSVGASPVCA